jgi:hypothetical protein
MEYTPEYKERYSKEVEKFYENQEEVVKNKGTILNKSARVAGLEAVLVAFQTAWDNVPQANEEEVELAF